MTSLEYKKPIKDDPPHHSPKSELEMKFCVLLLSMLAATYSARVPALSYAVNGHASQYNRPILASPFDVVANPSEVVEVVPRQGSPNVKYVINHNQSWYS